MLAKIQNPRINYLSRILALSIIVFTVLAFTIRTKKVAVGQSQLEEPIGHTLDQQKTENNPVDTVPQKQVVGKEVTLEDPNASKRDTGKNSNFLGTDLINPPLFILDGKEITKKELGELDAATIESINVWKNQTAIEKYGQKGANGVVEIISKSNLKVREVTLEPMTTDTVPRKNNQSKVNKQNETVFSKVEVEAPVDKEQWGQFLRKNLQLFIEDGTMSGIDPGTYTIQVKFIVAKDGSLSNFQALNDPGYGLAKRVLEIMKNSPKWNPAMQNGKPVNSYHTQPITFVVQEQGNDEKNKNSASPEVTLGELKKWDRINIENIVSFNLVYLSDNGKAVKHQNLTAKLDETSKAILARQKPGSIFTIEDILVKENGREIKKPAMYYKVQ